MDRLTEIVSGVAEAAGRIGEVAGETAQDRLELVALELREAQIRMLQFLLLACTGVVFALLGLVLALLTALYALPPEDGMIRGGSSKIIVCGLSDTDTM